MKDVQSKVKWGGGQWGTHDVNGGHGPPQATTPRVTPLGGLLPVTSDLYF